MLRPLQLLALFFVLKIFAKTQARWSMHAQERTKIPPLPEKSRAEMYENWHIRNAAAFQSNEWQPLKVLLLKSPDLLPIPQKIFRSLVTAINNLSLMISVRSVGVENGKKSELFDMKTVINECAGVQSITNITTDETPYIVESFVHFHSSKNVELGNPNLASEMLGLGNFMLILQTDEAICKTDNFLLAAAAPCSQPREKDDYDRPLLGRLIICYESPAWKNFHSGYDLFRHEILHALGFGLLMPQDDDDSVESKFYEWKIFGGKRSIPFEAHFMDFAKEATEYAKKYFDCDQIVGIEAEDENKIHLSEYIFGNELMTPAVNNGRNFFTHFTATILEQTYNGEKAWYSTNSQIVERESREYWWARGAGCAFLNSSCFDLIEQRKNGQIPRAVLVENEIMAKEDVIRGDWTLAFCDEADLIDKLSNNTPKHLCFWNGTAIAEIEVHCKTTTRLQMRPLFYEPLTLQSQFPALMVDENGRSPPIFYGSDYDHRYCPFTNEMIEGDLVNIPWNAKLVPCKEHQFF